MIFLTHLAFAFLIWTLFPSSFELMILLFAGALLPDVDTGTSVLGKRLKIPALIFGHRKFFHSIFAMVLFGILVSFSMGTPGAVYLMTGYFSHIVLDALTKKGVMVFWPSKIMIKGPMRTGSLADLLVFVGCLAASILIIIK